MAFIKTRGYWENKIKNIESAIAGTKNTLAGLTEQRQIDAHESYLASCKRSLIQAKRDFEKWLKTHE